MDIEKVFKRVVLADFILLIMMILLAFFPGTNTTIEEEPFTSGEIFSLILLVVYIVNLYFLYKLKPIAKTLYIPLFLISVVLIFAFPESYLTYSNRFEYVLEVVGAMTSGLIIGLLYWSDVSKKFDNIKVDILDNL